MLSVVITAWNEAQNLPRVVESVRKLADEIVVVVDQSSTDGTKQVATKLGCTVYSHAHSGFVEPMRNYSISKAKNDWVLLLDADEEIPSGLGQKIKSLISRSDVDYYRLSRKNIIFNKWIKSQHWWPDYVYRLFKKGHITWEDTIHSVPFTRGRGEDLPSHESLAIIHHHYDSVSQYLDRINRYTDHQLRHLHDNNHRFSPADLIVYPVKEFLSQYFARRGYSEGLHGLALSLLQAYSELVLYLKFWETLKFPQNKFTPGDLNNELRKTNNELSWWYYQSKIDSAPFVLKPWWKFIRRLKV